MSQREAEGEVLRRLWDELRHSVDLNAALGYELDPALPAPEVFERPGWKVRWATPSAREWHIAISDECSMTAAAEPDMHPSIRTEVVRPIVHCTAEFWFHPGEQRWYGLGFSERVREWIIFSSHKADSRGFGRNAMNPVSFNTERHPTTKRSHGSALPSGPLVHRG